MSFPAEAVRSQHWRELGSPGVSPFLGKPAIHCPCRGFRTRLDSSEKAASRQDPETPTTWRHLAMIPDRNPRSKGDASPVRRKAQGIIPMSLPYQRAKGTGVIKSPNEIGKIAVPKRHKAQG